MGLLQLSNHVVQNRQTGEQATHWDMLNKENSNLVALFNISIPIVSFALQLGYFVPHDHSAATGPLYSKTIPVSSKAMLILDNTKFVAIHSICLMKTIFSCQLNHEYTYL